MMKEKADLYLRPSASLEWCLCKAKANKGKQRQTNVTAKFLRQKFKQACFLAIRMQLLVCKETALLSVWRVKHENMVFIN